MHKSVRAHVLHVFRAQVVSAFDLKMGASEPRFVSRSEVTVKN